MAWPTEGASDEDMKMPKENLDLFVAVLPAFGQVYAPVKRGQGYAFDTPAFWSDVCLDYPRTILPPKKFLLPPRETTFVFDSKDGFRDQVAEAHKPVVLFGFTPMTFSA